MDAAACLDGGGGRPLVYLTRVEHFSSGHRLNNPNCDVATNQSMFGKCNHQHGHNYKLEVVVKGHVDPVSGMVMDIAQLKVIIERQVLAHLDHKNIDQDVGYFRRVPSTAENIAIYIWRQLATELPAHVRLAKVKLHETDKNVVEFMGFE